MRAIAELNIFFKTTHTDTISQNSPCVTVEEGLQDFASK